MLIFLDVVNLNLFPLFSGGEILFSFTPSVCVLIVFKFILVGNSFPVLR